MKDGPRHHQPSPADQMSRTDQRDAADQENPTDRAAAGAGVPVELRGLSIHIGERALLERADALFPGGRITLIVGCSGVGKSLLLKHLAGLLDPEGEVRASGRVLLNGHPAPRVRRGVGVVFQHFALFDELSPAGNVYFAAAHRTRDKREAIDQTDPDHLLDELNVPRDVRTGSLSGGQRQRLAIARTLAYHPDVILYDEPTSGLDAATAVRVARLIETTHEAHPRTSIIVTHDYESLSSIADRIYLFDADAARLREVPRQHWPQLREWLSPPSGASKSSSASDSATGGPSATATASPGPPLEAHRPLGALGPWGQRLSEATRRVATAVGRGVPRLARSTSRVAEAVVTAPWNLLPLWRSPVWGLRFLLHYLRLVAGPSAWLYIGVAGLIIGFVTTYFTFRFLPYARYTEPLLIEDLLRSMGFALFRILVPVLATILVAARCGAAVASDVGGKSYGRQVDALRSFAVSPRRYLLTNILLAFLVGTPLLLLIGYFTSAATSMVVFTASYPEFGPDFWQLHFHNRLIVPGRWFFAGSGWLLAKTLLCAAGIGLIAYYRGVAPKHSSNDVSRSVTATILWATMYVLVVHFVFAFYEFEKDVP